MKKSLHIFFLSAFLIGALGAMAQDQSSTSPAKKKKAKAKSYIEISGGISVPLGNYAKTDYNNNNAGFANVGPLLSISGVHYISHNFGIGGSFSYAFYNVKNAINLADGYHESFDVDSTNVHATRYTAIHVMVGPYYSIPLGIVTIDLRALGGINCMTSPHIDVLLEDGGNSYTNGNTAYSFWQNSSLSMVLAAQFGAGIRITPVKHFSISVRADYFYSKPDFTITNDYRSASVGRVITSYNQPFNGINATLGLVYEFGRKDSK